MKLNLKDIPVENLMQKKKKTLDKEKICAWEAIHSVISLSTGDW
jgi:hypothetical protein